MGSRYNYMEIESYAHITTFLTSSKVVLCAFQVTEECSVRDDTYGNRKNFQGVAKILCAYHEVAHTRINYQAVSRDSFRVNFASSLLNESVSAEKCSSK